MRPEKSKKILLVSRRSFIISSLLVVLWMIVIYVLSSQPSGASNHQSELIVSPLRHIIPSLNHTTLTFIVRKGAHIVAYCVLGGLVHNAIWRGIIYKHVRVNADNAQTPYLRRLFVIWAIVICSLYAVTDEVHQLYVPGRSGEVRDVFIDSVAAMVGVLIMFFVYRWVARVHSGKI